MIKHSLIVFLALMSYISFGQSQGVTNSQTKLRPNQLRWSPTDATLDSVYIIRADTSTGEPGWYLVTLSGGGGVQDTALAGDVVGGLNSTFVRKINGVTVENITPQNREVLTYNGTQWTPDSIALEDLPQMNASRVLGRGSSSAGAVTQLTPSNGVKISGNYIESDLTAGTGINISGTTTLTVSNSAPDQIVTISGATGTYPNFTVSGGTPSGSSGQVQYNNAGSFGALDSFTVASNPDRLGVGVPVPTARVDIQGSGATSATNAFRVRNSAGTNLLTVRNDGFVNYGVSGGDFSALSPDLVLVGRSANTNSRFYIQNTSTGGNFGDGLRLEMIDLDASLNNSENGYIRFVNNGAERLRITSSGLFGFGINAPLAGIHNAINTTASTPSMLLSGTGYSGGTATTTKPTLLIEPTGTTSTGWSTSGTKLGVNAESGFTGRYLDIQLAGVSKFNVQADKINMSTSKTPSSATDTGTIGDICWDSNYIYVCVGTNTWKRTAITTW